MVKHGSLLPLNTPLENGIHSVAIQGSWTRWALNPYSLFSLSKVVRFHKLPGDAELVNTEPLIPGALGFHGPVVTLLPTN